MQHSIIVKTYNGIEGSFTVPNEVVDSLYLVLHYYISGDEVYNFITEDGEIYVVDAADLPDAPMRQVSCGPENMSVIFPDEMQWRIIHEA